MAKARKHSRVSTIISAALTGVLATREQCPAIPYTPREIGEEAARAAGEGAAIVHIHALDRNRHRGYDDQDRDQGEGICVVEPLARRAQ